MRFTLFGGRGFIGRALRARLLAAGHEVFVPPREFTPGRTDDLGHVIYAVGVTSDFRERPLDAIEAHAALLARLLAACTYQSWLYLSSCRVYGLHSARGAFAEDDALTITPGSDSVYDLSKLLGESLCLSVPRRDVRIARLSNVLGEDPEGPAFFPQVVRSLRQSGSVDIDESADSGKDYIALDDVLRLLPLIATRGTHRCYNVASGTITSHEDLLAVIHGRLGGVARFGTRFRLFAHVDVSRIRDEFDFTPTSIMDCISDLLSKHSD